MKANAIAITSRCLCCTVFVGLGMLLALTNPRRSTYDQYAAQQATNFLISDICGSSNNLSVSLNPFIGESCQSYAAQGQKDIRDFLQHNTQHHNFGLFSLFTTELPIQTVRVVGVFNRFYVVSFQ